MTRLSSNEVQYFRMYNPSKNLYNCSCTANNCYFANAMSRQDTGIASQIVYGGDKDKWLLKILDTWKQRDWFQTKGSSLEDGMARNNSQNILGGKMMWWESEKLTSPSKKISYKPFTSSAVHGEKAVIKKLRVEIVNSSPWVNRHTRISWIVSQTLFFFNPPSLPKKMSKTLISVPILRP